MAEALCGTCDVEVLARRMHGLPTVKALEEHFAVKLPGVSVVDLDAEATTGLEHFARRPWSRAAMRRVADVRDDWLVREGIRPVRKQPVLEPNALSRAIRDSTSACSRSHRDRG